MTLRDLYFYVKAEIPMSGDGRGFSANPWSEPWHEGLDSPLTVEIDGVERVISEFKLSDGRLEIATISTLEDTYLPYDELVKQGRIRP